MLKLTFARVCDVITGIGPGAGAEAIVAGPAVGEGRVVAEGWVGIGNGVVFRTRR